MARRTWGGQPPGVGGATYRVAPDYQQQDRVGDLPFGTRGGTLVQHLFPQDADYDIKVEIAGARNVQEEHQLEITIDGEQMKLFKLVPRNSGGTDYMNQVDGKLEVRIPVKAGPHEVGVAFYRNPADLIEQVREPFPNPRVSGNEGGAGGSFPAGPSLSVAGPSEP